ERDQRMREIAHSHPRVHAWLERLVEASEHPTSSLQIMFRRAGDAALSDMRLRDNALPPGTRIGDWRLADPVGAGGMGLVYRAERADGTFEMSAAIKFIRSPDDALMSERLTLETQLLARLDHPNIARILDGGTLPDGQNYLVMEWIEGEDLTECREKAGALRNRCLGLFEEIAEAVSHAHQRQVVHGDIKPANIRIARDGRPRLLDFGVARLTSGDLHGSDRTEALTPAFSAPEQLAGGTSSTRSDIYALGALLRWMLTGNPGGGGGGG
ncbi:MAG: serine/threonine-protein kinase, partial [Wenzhouxiangellaceae bacterium]